MMRSDEIETIQSIKDKTRYYIERCSPESNIRYTDYFNHTFIPDMVIDWNKQERYLYIRTTSDINWIFEDAKLLDISIQSFSQSKILVKLPIRALLSFRAKPSTPSSATP